MPCTLFEPPAMRPTDVKLRPYQDEAINAIRQEFTVNKRKSTLLVMATGLGKTLVFGQIARLCAERGGRTLVLAHRGELIDQAVETLTRLGLDPGVEKADSRARATFEPDVVVATVQTMQRKRLESWDPDWFRLVVYDEAHHGTAQTYQNIYRYFNALHLGVTATPDRADGEMLGDVFESLAFEYTLWDAMTAPAPGPYLCRLRFVQCDVGIDLRDIRTTAGDLNAADLEEAIRPHVEALANAIRQEIGDRKTLVFTPDVGSAQAMATALDAIGVRSKWVAGDSADRKPIIEEFKHGDFQCLSNCNLLLEGFDDPGIAAIALCRPTKSRPLYAQIVGRGTRLYPGKDNCLLIDFNWLTTKHQLVKPAELFDSSMTDAETLAIAGELLKGPGAEDGAEGAEDGEDLLDVIERAEAEKRRRTVLRIQAREREMRYRKVSYDPLSVMETLGIPVREEADRFRGTITDKQKQFLVACGITNVDGLSKYTASRMIGPLKQRRADGLATHKQVTTLISKGIEAAEARALTFEEASATLDRLLGGRRRTIGA
jgi:superfamily II DNA or RNA helicase